MFCVMIERQIVFEGNKKGQQLHTKKETSKMKLKNI